MALAPTSAPSRLNYETLECGAEAQGLSGMTTPLITREVRRDADGMPWTSQRDPVLRDRILDVYCKLCESGESGRQLVAVHQEVIALLDRLVKDGRRRKRNDESRRRTGAHHA